MYRKGEVIVYGNTGVCQVVEHTEDKEKNQTYYVLKPLFQSGLIYTPTDSRVYMRPVLSREEAEGLIDLIPQIHEEGYHNPNVQSLAAHYDAAIKSHDCETLLRLTMSIYAKKREMERNKRKLGQVDTRFMKRAEELVFGEFAVALDIPREEVPAFIRHRVKTSV